MNDFTEFSSEQEFVPELLIIGKSRESEQILDQALYTLGHKTYGQVVFNDTKEIDKSKSIIYNQRCRMPVLFRSMLEPLVASLESVNNLQREIEQLSPPEMNPNHNIGAIVDVSHDRLENFKQLFSNSRRRRIKYIVNVSPTDMHRFLKYRSMLDEICICGPMSQYSKQDLEFLYKCWCTQWFEYDEFVDFLKDSLAQYGCVVLFRNQQRSLQIFYIRVDTTDDQFSRKYGPSMLGTVKCKYNRRLWNHRAKVELSRNFCLPLVTYILSFLNNKAL